MSFVRRVKSNVLLGEHSRGLAKYDQNSSSIGLTTTLLSLRDHQTQVKDWVDVNSESFSEANTTVVFYCAMESLRFLDTCRWLK
jgi:hypothetical protein